MSFFSLLPILLFAISEFIEIFMLDDLDRRLLRQFQANPTLTAAELADRAEVSGLKAARRLARMQDQGVIRAKTAQINWAALGYEAAVSLRFTLDKTVPQAFDAFIAAARDIPEVTEIQTFLGRVDVRLMVVARDMNHYQSLYRARILALPHIAELEALMTVATVKSTESLPL